MPIQSLVSVSRKYAESMALLLVMNHRLSAIDMEMRLSKRRKDGRNPFPSSYDDKLVEHCEMLPEVDANKEIANGRVDLRIYHFCHC